MAGLSACDRRELECVVALRKDETKSPREFTLPLTVTRSHAWLEA